MFRTNHNTLAHAQIYCKFYMKIVQKFIPLKGWCLSCSMGEFAKRKNRLFTSVCKWMAERGWLTTGHQNVSYSKDPDTLSAPCAGKWTCEWIARAFGGYDKVFFGNRITNDWFGQLLKIARTGWRRWTAQAVGQAALC